MTRSRLLIPLAVTATVAAAAILLVGPLDPTATAPQARAGDGRLRLVDAFPGHTFQRPVYVTQAPDPSGRFFVVEQAGRIQVMQPGGGRTTFLDITDQVSRRGNEEGLLGLAFDPDFVATRRFFVHYSHAYRRGSDRRGVLSSFTVDPKAADRADPKSERVLLEVRQPFANHNGGTIEFGPDGMLYFTLGDGGAANDPYGNGQDLGTLLAAILRLDVTSNPRRYKVPPDNPFVGRRGARGEIWAYGLRNVWRFSFDRETGEMWGGDVGQNAFEEVDLIRRGGNYGWNVKEGEADFRRSRGKKRATLIPPLAIYGRDEGVSITGGYVYRGNRIPWLRGTYLYADYNSGRIWGLTRKAGLSGPPKTSADVEVVQLLDTRETIASFGEDRDGELYLCSFSGRVFRIEGDEGPPEPPPFPKRLSETKLFADLAALEPVPGALRYEVRSELWSDGAKKDRFVVLPEGKRITWRDRDALELPEGGQVVKTFTLPGRGGRMHRLETRVIRRDSSGYEAATYRWNDEGTDALLVERPARVVVRSARGLQEWLFPGPAQCRNCHTQPSGFLLGVRARQLANAAQDAEQGDLVERWARKGVLDGEVPPAGAIPRNVAIGSKAPLGERARSYLDSNCSSCHRPDAPLASGLDLRAETPLAQTGLLDVLPTHGALGVEDARLISPRKPAKSVLLTRMRTRAAGRMPPLASSVVDEEAVKVLERWIRSLPRGR